MLAFFARSGFRTPLLLTLFIMAFGPAAFADGRIGTMRHRGDCVTAVRPNEELRMAECNSQDPSQYWFYAPGNRLLPAESTTEEALRLATFGLLRKRVIRNVNWPNHCLGVDDREREGEVFRLYRCAPRSGQHWIRRLTPFDDPLQSKITTRENPCADRDGNRLRVRTGCLGATQFDFTFHGIVSNFDIAFLLTRQPELRRNLRSGARATYARFETCVTRQLGVGGECYLRSLELLNLLGDDKSVVDITAYGYAMGKGNTTSTTFLDLGARYSVDRCAKGHDANYWGYWPLHGSDRSNDANFVSCLLRVLSFSNEDREALREAYTAFAVTSRTPTGADSACLGRSAGYLPSDRNIDVDRCICDLVEFSGTNPGQSEWSLEELIDVIADHPSDGQCKGAIRTATERLAAPDAPPIADPAPQSYTLEQGDWIWRLGERAGAQNIPTYIAEFEALNSGVDANIVYIGQSYVLPYVAPNPG